MRSEDKSLPGISLTDNSTERNFPEELLVFMVFFLGKLENLNEENESSI